MNRKKKLILGLFLFWLLWMGTYLGIRLEFNGPSKLELKIGDPYEELVGTGSFLGAKLRVRQKGTVDVSKVGTYEVKYWVRNWFGIKKTKVRTVVVRDASKPILRLNGNSYETLTVGTPYKEAGYHSEDEVDGDLTGKVIVEGTVDVSKVGRYELIYRVEDSSGNVTVVKRIVQVVKKMVGYQDRYDSLDNTKNGWWSGNKFDHQRPTGGGDLEKLKEQKAYFLGPDDKTIYLTFDEGSNDTYLDPIADILKQNGVQGTFFLCGNYMKNNAEQVKKWVEQGHSIGNHTYHHRSSPDYAVRQSYEEFKKEIVLMEELYQEITGKPMDKIYRDPKGEWSFRSLAMVKDLGYKSFFWSADYLDFDKVYTKEYAYEQMIKRYHNGAIYLLHPKQKGTYEALDSFIKEMKKMGYQFGLVRDIDY